MSEDREMTTQMEEVVSLLQGWKDLTNLNQEFALHLLPTANLHVVAESIAKELKRQESTVYCLNVGRSSDGKVAIIVKFREKK